MAGGGVGEAMLIGAAVGAASGGGMAALNDEDPLQGALMGAALGAAGGGIGSAVGGVASGAASGTAGGTTGGVTGGTAGGAAGGAAGGVEGSIAGEATSQLGQQALQNAATTQGFTIPQGYQLGTGTLGNQVAVSQGFEPIATGTGFTEDVITKAAAPQAWGQQGVGQGFAPSLTNAQAYGAGIGGGIAGLAGGMDQNSAYEPEPYNGPLSQFKYNPSTYTPTTYSPTRQFAAGGVASLPVRQQDAYPQSGIESLQFSNPTQMPASMEVLRSDYDSTINPYTGDQMRFAEGGISNLGSYSDGGRLLRGPGDGMSDNIPASIAGKQPARLADGEFVVPADVVSHLGNGSTDAGAKKLYSMMDNVRKARTGNKKQGREIKSEKYIPGMAEGGRVERFASGNLVVNPETNEVGYWSGGNEWGDGATWNPISSEQKSLGNVSGAQGAAGYKASTYDPNYYNQQYYQNQLDAANKQISQLQSLKAFDPTYYLAQYPDIAADRHWSQNPLQHYQEYGIKEGRSPYEGGQAGVQLLDTAALQAAQQQAAGFEQNLSRLSSSPNVQYSPYTLANRPSQDEPQFYGNIYRPEYENYAQPGYDMNANMGAWNNLANSAAGADQRQVNIHALAQEQGAVSQANAQQAQQAAQQAIQSMNKEAPNEEKKRRGGIASLKRA